MQNKTDYSNQRLLRMWGTNESILQKRRKCISESPVERKKANAWDLPIAQILLHRRQCKRKRRNGRNRRPQTCSIHRRLSAYPSQPKCKNKSLSTSRKIATNGERKKMPTYDQMLFFPRQAFDAFQDYCEAHSIHSDDNRTKKVNAISKTDYKKLVRSCKRWLKANHRMWSVIVSHLQSTSMHVTSGMEISNGIVLISTLKTKFGNTHAQCLATMLRILTNVTMHTKDPNTGKPETVIDYMDRVQRITRDASSFPSMKVPIPQPLVKVFALEGLLKSDKKYSSIVTMAYSNDLSDSIETVTNKCKRSKDFTANT